MAFAAQCAYCFEVLVADLEDREPLEYRQLLDLWSQFQSRGKDKLAATEDQEVDGGLQDGEDMEDGDSLMGGTEAEEDEEEEKPPKPTPSNLRLPSKSRLQALSPASGRSSASTPSSLSTTSSRAALGDSSKSSSKSSFFSFGRSKQPSPAAPLKEEEYPLFVTWDTVSAQHGHKSLRGCIGTFEAQEISSGLKSYALTAAFSDTRFSPISIPELSTLSNTITLLTNFTPCADIMDWDLGTHGIRIAFSHHGKRYTATYLPHVAVEQGWNKESTVVSLMRKAGWGGRSRDWREVKAMNVVRYQGMKASLGWSEWKIWREWVDAFVER